MFLWLQVFTREAGQYVFDQFVGDFSGMHGVAQHAHAGLACACATVLVDGFGDATQEFAGVGQGVGWVHVGLDGEEWGAGGFAVGWVRDEFFHGVGPSLR